MAALLSRAVRSRQVLPTESAVLDINGEHVTVPAELIEQAMRRAWETGKPHNLARVTFNKSAVAAITRLLAAQLRDHGNTIDDSDQGWLREDVRTAQDVKVALNSAWLPLTPQKLIQDLFARPQWLASLTPGWSDRTRALLARARSASYTVSDVPLLDEAAELLGHVDEAADFGRRELKQQRKRDLENARAAIENMQVKGLVDAQTLAEGFEASGERGTTAELAAADRSWAYGHVVVDEAQELSPMQWRLLVRRNPLKSFTVVGDIAQASAAAGATGWREALAPHIGDNWRLEELTVNYRTPAQISALAESMALAHGVAITRSRAVREGEWPVLITHASDAAATGTGSVDEAVSGTVALAASVLEAVRHDREIDSTGTLAVIASSTLIDAIFRSLSAALGDVVGRGPVGLTRPVAVLTPTEAKGLEFDSVIIAEPQRIIDETRRGPAALYVAMTRPTRRLHLVIESTVPAGLVPTFTPLT